MEAQIESLWIHKPRRSGSFLKAYGYLQFFIEWNDKLVEKEKIVTFHDNIYVPIRALHSKMEYEMYHVNCFGILGITLHTWQSGKSSLHPALL